MSVYMETGGKEFDALDREIKKAMRRSAKEAVRLGYMLRQMTERQLWTAYFSSLDEYLEKELHMEYSMANRFMNINRKFSERGDSMEIAEKYEAYSQGCLIEMLSMPPELEAQVTPDMTVRQVREIKRKAKQEKEAPMDGSTPGQASIEDFPEHMPEPDNNTEESPDSNNVVDGEYREIESREEIATSQPEESRAHDGPWFVERYVNIMPGEAAELFEICREEQNNSDRAKAIQKHIAPYGYHGTGCSEYSFSFHGFAAGIDFRVGSEEMHLKYGRFVVELMKLLEKEVATSQPEEKLSPYGLPKTVYPEGSLVAVVGCGHKYSCFDCAQDCEIRQKDSYCVEAPLGNPFPCTTMHVLGNIRSEIGGQCQFINLDTAEHTARGNSTPCCKKCDSMSCGYRCERSKAINGDAEPADPAQGPKEIAAPQPDADTYTESEPQDDSEIVNEFSELRRILEAEKKLLNDYMEIGGLPERTVFRQKTIVAALAAMVCDLENIQAEPEPQPELPALKNNDQRKEWLGNYKAWGLWYRDEKIDVNYYKYDFPDDSRLVVAEYPQRYCYWSSQRQDEYYFHLLEKDRKGYDDKTYDEQYRNQTDSETYLVDFLKSLQKKGQSNGEDGKFNR